MIKNKNLKIEKFLQQFSHKKALLRKHRNAINALLNANKNVDFDSLFPENPTKLSRSKEFEIQDQAKQAIKNCMKELVQRKLSGTTIINYMSSIKTLFEQHEIILKPNAWKEIKSLQTQYGNTFHSMTPTKQQMQKILSNADALEKAFSLTMLTTGLRPIEILNIELNDLHLKEQPPRIVIKTINTQTKRRIPNIYITEECKIAIENYMPQISRYVENKKISHLPNTNINNNNQSNKLFPISDVTIRHRWNKLLKNSNLNEINDNGKQKRHIFNLYTLRAYFRTYLNNSDLAEHLIGHKDISNQYYNKQEEEIKKDYIIYSKNLYIYSNPILPEEITKKGSIEILTDKVKSLEENEKKLNKQNEQKIKKVIEEERQKIAEQFLMSQNGCTLLKTGELITFQTNQNKKTILYKENDKNNSKEIQNFFNKNRKKLINYRNFVQEQKQFIKTATEQYKKQQNKK